MYPDHPPAGGCQLPKVATAEASRFRQELAFRCSSKDQGSRTPMTMRTSSNTVTFLHPFKLSGVDDVQPAGRYVVETDEELLQIISHTAYRRLSTFIRLPGRSGSTEWARIVDVEPTELATVLASDVRVQDVAPLLADRTATAPRRRRRGAREFMMNGWKRWLALNATELKLTALIGGALLAGLFVASGGAWQRS